MSYLGCYIHEHEKKRSLQRDRFCPRPLRLHEVLSAGRYRGVQPVLSRSAEDRRTRKAHLLSCSTTNTLCRLAQSRLRKLCRSPTTPTSRVDAPLCSTLLAR